VRQNAEFVDGFYSEEMGLESDVLGPLVLTLAGEPVLSESVGRVLTGTTALALPPTFTNYTINIKMGAEEIEIIAASETEAKDGLTGKIEVSIAGEADTVPATGQRKPKLSKKPKLPTSILALLSSLIDVSFRGEVAGEDVDTSSNSRQLKFVARVPTGGLDIELDQRPGISG